MIEYSVLLFISHFVFGKIVPKFGHWQCVWLYQLHNAWGIGSVVFHLLIMQCMYTGMFIISKVFLTKDHLSHLLYFAVYYLIASYVFIMYCKEIVLIVEIFILVAYISHYGVYRVICSRQIFYLPLLFRNIIYSISIPYNINIQKLLLDSERISKTTLES